MSAEQDKTCSICNIPLHGEYCHQCGQKVTGKRLNVNRVVQDPASNVFSLDTSVLATILQLLKNPSKVIENYWAGNRKYYESPSKLMVYASLVIGLHLLYHKNLIFGLAFSDDPQIFFILFFIFLFTTSSYLLYLKNKHRFLEVLVANLYLFCALIIASILVFEVFNLFIEDDESLGYSIVLLFFSVVTFYSARVLAAKRKWYYLTINTFLQLILIFIIAFGLLLGLTSISDLEMTL